MAQHAILRFEKHKGHPAGPLEAHHERKKEQYASNPDIDTSRSKYNFHIVKPDGRYYHFIQSRIEQARCRTRKDSTRFVDTLITASPEFFKGKSPKEIAAYFQRAADFLIDRVGRENIVSAMVHMDEKTPHLHLVFVPLTKDNRLCAKEIIGNRANLTKWQDDFHACMVEQYPDLERGESASKTGRKHIPTRLFKQAVNLSKQARAIEAVLSGITPLNAGKKKEEALSMLKKWFPQMENFSGQLKKYKVTINDLLAENEKLEVRAKASEKGKMNDTMERAKLKSELDDMRRLVDRIPPVIAIVVAWFIWNKTTFGKNMYAVGGNAEAASVSGISVFKVTMGVFIMAGIFYGCGGFLEAFKANASAGTGQGYELDAIAACVVGGISFNGGIGKIGGAVIGVIIFTGLTYCLTFLGIDTNLQFVFKGFIIIAAVALDSVKYLKKK